MNNIIKKITVFLFIFTIFLVPTTMLLTKDKDINEIENKILQKFPRFNYENIKSGRFMSQFDKYTSDQFPLRNTFLYMKNELNYILGKREFRDVYITSNGRLLDKYTENKDCIRKNIEYINKSLNSVRDKSTLFIVPNSVAVYNDELKDFYLRDNQEDTIDYISSISNIKTYSPLNVLKLHRDDYIYFNTDHHWTQLGAKISFEDFYGDSINEDYNMISNEFYGSYYSKAMLKRVKSDKIYSYSKLGGFYNVLDGEERDNLYDSSKLEGKNKYQYFLSGDPSEGFIKGTGKGSILVVKDSFAHNFIPFLAQKYENIHIFDPRYSNMSLLDYTESKPEINEVLVLLSVSTLNSTILEKR